MEQAQIAVMTWRECIALFLSLCGPLLLGMLLLAAALNTPDWAVNTLYYSWLASPLVGLSAPWFGNRTVLPYAFGAALLAPAGAVTAVAWLLTSELM